MSLRITLENRQRALLADIRGTKADIVSANERLATLEAEIRDMAGEVKAIDAVLLTLPHDTAAPTTQGAASSDFGRMEVKQ